MGWINEQAPDHEGYLVAVVRQSTRAVFSSTGTGRVVGKPFGVRWFLRELAYPGDAARVGHREIHSVQVACSCGWRSSRQRPPRRAEWVPYSVELHDDAEGDGDRLVNLWHEQHLAFVGAAPRGVIATIDHDVQRCPNCAEGFGLCDLVMAPVGAVR